MREIQILDGQKRGSPLRLPTLKKYMFGILIYCVESIYNCTYLKGHYGPNRDPSE